MNHVTRHYNIKTEGFHRKVFIKNTYIVNDTLNFRYKLNLNYQL